MSNISIYEGHLTSYLTPFGIACGSRRSIQREITHNYDPSYHYSGFINICFRDRWIIMIGEMIKWSLDVAFGFYFMTFIFIVLLNYFTAEYVFLFELNYLV